MAWYTVIRELDVVRDQPGDFVLAVREGDDGDFSIIGDTLAAESFRDRDTANFPPKIDKRSSPDKRAWQWLATSHAPRWTSDPPTTDPATIPDLARALSPSPESFLGAFDESQHPRERGRFTNKDGADRPAKGQGSADRMRALTERVQKAFPNAGSVNLGEMDARMGEAFATRVEAFAHDFPRAAAQVSEVAPDGQEQNVMAVDPFDTRGPSIHITDDYFRSDAAMREVIGDMQKNYHAITTTPEGIFDHELGHVLDATTRNERGAGLYDGPVDLPESVRAAVSEYGSIDAYHETFADAYSAKLNDPAAYAAMPPIIHEQITEATTAERHLDPTYTEASHPALSFSAATATDFVPGQPTCKDYLPPEVRAEILRRQQAEAKQGAFDEAKHPRASGRFTFADGQLQDADEAQRQLKDWAGSHPRGTVYRAMQESDVERVQREGTLTGSHPGEVWVSDVAKVEYVDHPGEVVVAIKLEPGDTKAMGGPGDREIKPVPADRIIDVFRGPKARAAATFDESQHPRAEHGRFGDKGGGTPVAVKEHTDVAALTAFHDRFEAAMKDSPYAGFVSHHTVAEMQREGMTPVLRNGGQTGVLVWDHGDGRVEATSLYDTSGQRGAGLDLLRDAVDNHGVNYVEAFGPYLPTLYGTLGFKDDHVYPFDPGQAPQNWNGQRFDAPDYHTMRLAA